MKEVNKLDYASLLLIIAGAINWGLEGLGYFADQNLNLVNLIFVQGLNITIVEPVLYVLIGLSGLYQVYFGYELYDAE